MTSPVDSSANNPDPVAASPEAKPGPFVALRHRNFLLLWSGQLISLTGSMMQMAAILWHVALLAPPDRKGLALGLVGLVRVVPIFTLALLGGLFADVHNRRKLMLITQVVMALVATSLAVLTYRGLDTVWPLYVLTALGAAATAFDAPARQSLVPNLVPQEHLPNAISLYAAVIQASSVAGPSLAGMLIAGFGLTSVYALDAISFLFVITGLLLMRDVPDPSREAAERATLSFDAIAEGLRYVFSKAVLRSTMVLDFVATFFASATALLPIFAQDILDVGPQGYGWLYAAPAVGAVMSAAVMVRIVDRIDERGRVLLWAVAAYGLATIIFGISSSFWLTFACLALTGAADTVSMVLRNIIRQIATPDRLRGRMVGVNMVFFMGGPQLGELEAGAVANWFGARVSVVTGGIACMLATAWIALRTPALRHYRR